MHPHTHNIELLHICYVLEILNIAALIKYVITACTCKLAHLSHK